MKFGEKIRMLRTEQHKTLESLSKVVGVSRQTLSRYETGVITNIPTEKIELLAMGLETTPAYLMGWQKETEAEIEKYDNLTKLYFQSVKAWSEDKFFTGDETAVIKMHFADLLIRYKKLIEATMYSKFELGEYLKSMALYNQTRQEPYTEKELIEQFFEQHLKREMDDICNWINAVPNRFSDYFMPLQENVGKQDLNQDG